MNPPIRILGLDPGLRKTGWGVIVSEGSKLGFVACGCIESDDKRTLAGSCTRASQA
jgi:crossover junction endodeoxyribonuclease RuvC